ncbi:hypothetical protein SACS_1821 [Parasaccharibacter apium]|uniref:Uncharacterized protein n=1 Tax=Parasaccharibacter apium TaxID=1510841 RepID=A0A7U7G3Y1_9PROT|nr:hypothetical protein SACS_1821 [Parasaccharibacter apium]
MIGCWGGMVHMGDLFLARFMLIILQELHSERRSFVPFRP